MRKRHDIPLVELGNYIQEMSLELASEVEEEAKKVGARTIGYARDRIRTYEIKDYKPRKTSRPHYTTQYYTKSLTKEGQYRWYLNNHNYSLNHLLDETHAVSNQFLSNSSIGRVGKTKVKNRSKVSRRRKIIPTGNRSTHTAYSMWSQVNEYAQTVYVNDIKKAVDNALKKI